MAEPNQQISLAETELKIEDCITDYLKSQKIPNKGFRRETLFEIIGVLEYQKQWLLKNIMRSDSTKKQRRAMGKCQYYKFTRKRISTNCR